MDVQKDLPDSCAQGRERERQKKRERRIGDLDGDIPSAMRQGWGCSPLANLSQIVHKFALPLSASRVCVHGILCGQVRPSS